MTGLTQPLVDLLENPAVIKVGLSLKDDFMMLHKTCTFHPTKLYRITGLCASIRNTGQKSAKRFTPSYLKKKYPNHNACPTGKLMY